MEEPRAIRAIRSVSQALLGRETVRLDEVGRTVTQGKIARSRKAVVVVHLYGGGVQPLANSEIAGSAMLKPASRGLIWSPVLRSKLLFPPSLS